MKTLKLTVLFATLVGCQAHNGGTLQPDTLDHLKKNGYIGPGGEACYPVKKNKIKICVNKYGYGSMVFTTK